MAQQSAQRNVEAKQESTLQLNSRESQPTKERLTFAEGLKKGCARRLLMTKLSLSFAFQERPNQRAELLAPILHRLSRSSDSQVLPRDLLQSILQIRELPGQTVESTAE